MSPLVIAQISDLHVGRRGERLFGHIDTGERLRYCVEAISRLPLPPDALVASGDLVNRGTAEEYGFLRELLAPLSMPVFLMPGNHDERSALRAAFFDHHYLPAQGHLCYSTVIGELRLIMLDTVVPGQDRGALDTLQLEWLERELTEKDGPVVLFMHHPPCETGIAYMDRIGVAADDAARFGALVARFGQVQRVCCGHVHRAIATRWCGTLVGVCPSSAFQYCADPREEAAALVTGEQPAYQLHFWTGGRLITHTLQIGPEG